MIMIKNSDRQIHIISQYELRCPDCETAEYLIEDEGVTKCTDCGQVVSQYVIDMDQDWHNYDDDGEDKSRVGNVRDAILGNDLSTTVSNTNAKHKISLSRIGSESKLQEGFRKIEEMAGKLDIVSGCTNTAKQLYKMMDTLKTIRSKNDVIGYTTASLYASCKLSSNAKQLKEFMVVSTLQKKVIGKYYKRIENESRRVGPKNGYFNVGYQSSTPAQLIPKFAANLGLEFNVKSAAEHVTNMAVELGITAGKAPATIAAASIFMCTLLYDTKTPIKDIVDMTDVTESTIRKCMKDLETHKVRLLPAHLHSIIKQ